MGSVLEALLRKEILPLEFAGDVRGRGLFLSVEFVQDKKTRLSFDTSTKFCDRVVKKALENGLHIMGNLGKTGNIQVDHIIMSPPYIVKEEELREMVAILKTSIEQVSAAVRAEKTI